MLLVCNFDYLRARSLSPFAQQTLRFSLLLSTLWISAILIPRYRLQFTESLKGSGSQTIRELRILSTCKLLHQYNVQLQLFNTGRNQQPLMFPNYMRQPIGYRKLMCEPLCLIFTVPPYKVKSCALAQMPTIHTSVTMSTKNLVQIYEAISFTTDRSTFTSTHKHAQKRY